jgi:hypothetical protein
VFSIGEEVKETNDSGFLGTVPTLHTQLLADNSMLQVTPEPLSGVGIHAAWHVVACVEAACHMFVQL